MPKYLSKNDVQLRQKAKGEEEKIREVTEDKKSGGRKKTIPETESNKTKSKQSNLRTNKELNLKDHVTI